MCIASTDLTIAQAEDALDPKAGFRCKNEMIRYGLVDESPGYVYPFVPTGNTSIRYPIILRDKLRLLPRLRRYATDVALDMYMFIM
jgi:hypothetical protein